MSSDYKKILHIFISFYKFYLTINALFIYQNKYNGRRKVFDLRSQNFPDMLNEI